MNKRNILNFFSYLCGKIRAMKNEVSLKEDELVSLKDVQGFEVNPFMVELQGRMYLQPRANTIIAKGQSIINTDTGELIDEAVLLGRRKIVDKSQFAKLYASEIGILYELSKPAQVVFLHLTKVMDYDNKAIFDYKKEHSKLGYSTHKQALIGIRELMTKNIIAPHSVSNIYWLNPTIVCKGERFAKYVEYVVGEDGEEIKVPSKTRLKEQGNKVYQALPEEVQDKMKYAGNAPTMDSNNDYLPFPDESPYNAEEEVQKREEAKKKLFHKVTPIDPSKYKKKK
jgi:hypothetical protein